MKTCTKCHLTKSIDDFAKCNRRPNGRQPKCKLCNAKYRKENAVSVAAAKVRWVETNRDRANEIMRNYVSRHYVRVMARMAEWKRGHPEWRAKENIRRRASLATPAWANSFFIAEAYALARLRTKILGSKWHVDHIVPLRSNLVCGLHTHHNLQVIPARANLLKNNRHWPDMP